MHEALEWFYVDRQPFLDPHGEHAAVIQHLSERLAGELAALGKPPTLSPPPAAPAEDVAPARAGE